MNKKLLSEVLGEEVTFIYEELDEYNMLHYIINNCKCRTNIYELAHKVKEWALSLNFKLYSVLVKDGSKTNLHKVFKNINKSIIDKTFRADTEPEAIFKAGEWVLKEINNGIDY